MGRTAAGGTYIAPHPLLRRQGLDVVGFIQQPQHEAYTEPYLDSVVPVHQLPCRWFERAAWWWLLAGERARRGFRRASFRGWGP